LLKLNLRLLLLKLVIPKRTSLLSITQMKRKRRDRKRLQLNLMLSISQTPMFLKHISTSFGCVKVQLPHSIRKETTSRKLSSTRDPKSLNVAHS